MKKHVLTSLLLVLIVLSIALTMSACSGTYGDDDDDENEETNETKESTTDSTPESVPESTPESDAESDGSATESEDMPPEESVNESETSVGDETEELNKEEEERLAMLREKAKAALENTKNNLDNILKFSVEFYNQPNPDNEMIVKLGYLSTIKYNLTNLEELGEMAIIEALRNAEAECASVEEKYNTICAEYDAIDELYKEAHKEAMKDLDNEEKQQKEKELYEDRRAVIREKSMLQTELEGSKENLESAQADFDKIKDSISFIGLGNVVKTVTDAINTFDGYLDVAENDYATMLEAYNEFTKVDADGNYVHDENVSKDIIAGYQEMKEAIQQMKLEISGIIEAYREVYEKVLVCYPDQNCLE